MIGLRIHIARQPRPRLGLLFEPRLRIARTWILDCRPLFRMKSNALGASEIAALDESGAKRQKFPSMKGFYRDRQTFAQAPLSAASA